MTAPPRRLRRQSFADAFRGILFMLTSQPNARVHLTATAGVIGFGAWLRLGLSEWIWIALAIGLVWLAEAFNTALEALADALHPESDPGVGRAKDVAAGAVLVAVLAASLIGLLVLGPHLLVLARLWMD